MLATTAAAAAAVASTTTSYSTTGAVEPSASMLMTTKSDTTTTDTKTMLHGTPSIATMSSTIATATATGIATPITTITSDPGILCFHHCNVKVFCFHLPHRCPKCKQVLDTGDDVGGDNGAGGAADEEDEGDACNNELGSNGYNGAGGAVSGRKGGGGVSCGIVGSTRLLPFRLPYPFIRASQYPCAIVLRPTTGDFLNDYNNSTDLHIAVTTSTGCVVEFDRHGLRRHRADNTRMNEWWQCLLVGDVPEPWYDYWDEILQQICNQPDRWTVSHYQEDSHNCYTFVLAFLQALAYDKLSAAARSKTSFCEKYIVPRTTTAGKYISLYRKLRDTGIYVHPHHQHQRHSVLKQQHKQQQQQYYYSLQHQHQQHLKQSRGRLRINGHINGGGSGGGSASALLANGGKATSIILRAPNLCTIEE
ncbi:uncharacterized protein LOC129246875 [Anastrepha obliqua]|uniref:uncharacterized protein LOC129246875 n=1 Tax=Anastrepha obliqua TaxID=95512 RepID=UPI00240A8028|nr:uncharacterized protein LOC129246875 [Anastrepha obliqua]XP_054741555.1 uncharacterized protein LOC129246875 [Anastrepha obliqua]